jgi:tetratricopeptide (TPR) repeat protein
MRKYVIPILLLLVLLPAVGKALGMARENQGLRNEEDLKYMPSAGFLRAASLGHDGLVADLIWFRAIQYYGEWRTGDHGIDFFENLVDVVIELDPNFEDAYRFAAQILAEDMGRSDDAIDLLQRGMVQNPQSWWLPFEAGFIEYTVGFDDAAAFDWFQRAATIPEAPDFPRRFAAFVASRAGHLEVSYELWKYIARTTDNDDLRDRAIKYVTELEDTLFRGAPIPEWAARKRVGELTR